MKKFLVIQLFNKNSFTRCRERYLREYVPYKNIFTSTLYVNFPSSHTLLLIISRLNVNKVMIHEVIPRNVQCQANRKRK